MANIQPKFYNEYQGNEILQPLVAEISWSKHLVFCYVKQGKDRKLIEK
jgi:hypothetical protein